MKRPDSQVLAAAAGGATLAGAIAAGLLMPAHRPPAPAPAPTVVHVVVDGGLEYDVDPAGPSDLEWLLLQPVLPADELEPADNP